MCLTEGMMEEWDILFASTVAERENLLWWKWNNWIIILIIHIVFIRFEDISEDELDDREVQNIIIVTQTPAVLRKHPGGDRTAQSYHRNRLSLDAAETINIGLYFYEQVRCACSTSMSR